MIGHPTSAINELIKNGYDADATTVHVYIHIEKTPEDSFAIIWDNGSGMDDTILFGDWLQPGVSNKRENPRSEIFERSLLGNKGIGRLAAMALGKTVTVISKTSNCKEYNWLSLQSAQFHTDDLLSKIKFPGGKTRSFQELFEPSHSLELRKIRSNSLLSEFLRKRCDSFLEGTIAVVEDLNPGLYKKMQDDFSKTEIEQSLSDTTILKSLEILITPLQLNGKIQSELIKLGLVKKSYSLANESSTFDLKYATNLEADFDPLTSEFESVKEIRIVEGFDYRIIGQVHDDGKVEGRFTYNRLIDDDKTVAFNIPAEEDKKSDKKEKTGGAGSFYFDIRVYDREKDSIDKLAKILGEKSNSNVRKILTELAGLRISKNGFGVKPYGEEVLDWMGLAQLRVSDPGKNITPNQMLGYIYLYSPKNDGLKEKTNREGFYDNAAFLELQKHLRRLIADIGQKRYNYRLKNNLGRPKTKPFSRPSSQAYIDFIVSRISDDEIVDKTKSYLTEFDTALDNAEKNLNLSERLASLGNSLELIYHELAQPLTILGGSEATIQKQVPRISPEAVQKKIKDELENLEVAIDTIDDLKESLQPAIGKSKKKTFAPARTFEKVCRLYKRDIADYSIQIKMNENLESYKMKANEHALWISFLNIINNAVFWLISSETEEKVIFLSLEEDKLVVSNNGPKIDTDLLDEIFEYGVSTKPGTNKTGLGLTFTRNILGRNGLTIEAENRDYGPAMIIAQQLKDAEND